MPKKRIEVCAILVGLLLSAIPTLGQLTAGSIVGTVFDPTGAAVSAATVVLTSVDTGASFSTTSNDAGIFTFPAIPVGEYAFTANANGFKTAVGNLQVQLNMRFSVTSGFSWARLPRRSK